MSGAGSPPAEMASVPEPDRLGRPTLTQLMAMNHLSSWVRDPGLGSPVKDRALHVEIDALGRRLKARRTPGLLALRGELRRRSRLQEPALVDFEGALALDPGCVPALLGRGELLLCRDNFPAALADFQRAVVLEPSNAWALCLRGEAFLRLRDVAAALADADAAVALDPSGAWAQVIRSEALREQRRYPEAVAALDEVVRLEPCPWAYVLRARTQFNFGDQIQGLKDLERALELDPGFSEAFAYRGEALRRLGRREEALLDFDRVLERSPGFSRARAWRAGVLRQLGRHEEAVREQTRALSTNPEYAWSYAERARSLLELGRFAEALADMNQAARLDPKHAWIYGEAGQPNQTLDEYPKIEAALSRAVLALSGGERAWALAWRGETRLKAGLEQEALGDLDEALRLDPQNASARAWRGLALAQRRDFERAMPDLDAAVRLDPASANAFAWRGAAHRQRGDWGRAVEDLDRAVALNPAATWALAWRGECRLGSGDLQGAVEDLEKAVHLHGQYADAHAWLAQALAGLGRHGEAAESASRALELRPRAPIAQSALLCRAVSRQALGDAAGSLEDFKRAAAAAPELLRERLRAAGGTGREELARLVEEAAASAERVDRGGKLLEEGKAADAEAELTAALGFAPTARALALRAEARRRRGAWDDALSDADGALAMDGACADAFLVRGMIHHARGRFEEAAAQARAAAGLDAETARPHVLLAEAERDQGRLAEARAALDAALAREPRNAWAFALRGAVRSELADPEALSDLDLALELQPELAQAAAWRLRLRLRAQDVSGAVADLERVRRLAPDRAYALCAWTVDKKATLAKDHADLAVLDRAAAASPSPWAQAWRGEVLLKLGRYEEAVSALDRALAQDAGLAWAYLWRGQARVKAGKPGAREDLERALALEPALAEARAWIAESRAAAGDWPAAFEAMDGYVDAVGATAPALAWRGFLRLREGHAGKALADLDAALAANPRVAWALGWRGRALSLLGRREEALAAYDAALRQDPGDFQVLLWRAESAFAQGDFVAGERDFAAALAQDPGNPAMADAYAARAQARVGREALEAVPGLDSALELLKRLLRRYAFHGAAPLSPRLYAESLADLDRALELRPGIVEIVSLRARLRLILGDEPGAFRDLESARRLCAEEPWVSLYQALALLGALPQWDRVLTLYVDDAYDPLKRPEQGDILSRSESLLDAALRARPDWVPALLLRAKSRLRAGRRLDAMADIDAASRLDPACPGVYVLKGLALASAGDRAEALASLERAMRLEPDAKVGFNTLVRSNGEIPNSLEGVALLDAALRAEPGAAWLLALRAELKRHPNLCDYAGAVEDLEAAVALAPEKAWIRAFLGRARANFNDPRRGLGELEHAIRLDPDCGWLWAWKGEALRKAGLPREALEALDRAVGLDPGYDLSYLWRGTLKRQQREPQAAVADLSQALAFDRDNAWAFAERSRALRALKRYPEAIEDLNHAVRLNPKYAWRETPAPAGEDEAPCADLDEALRLDPGSSWALAWRGHTKLQLQDLEGALRDLDGALARDAGLAWAWAWRGEALYKKEQFEAALASLDRAMALDAGYAPAHAWRGAALLRSGRALEAEAALSRAIDLDPKSAWAWAWRGEARVGAGRFEEGERDLSHALAMDRRNAHYHFWRAEARRNLERPAEAVADLDRALGLHPGHVLAWVSRAVCKGALGDLEGQRQDFDSALRLDPSLFESHREALESVGVRPPVLAAPPPLPDRTPFAGIDARVEFLGVLQWLVESHEVPDFARRLAPDLAAYCDAAARHFAPFRADPVLADVRQSLAEGPYRWFWMAQLLLSATAPPEMVPTAPVDGPRDPVRMLARLRDFARRCRFPEFFEAHRAVLAHAAAPLLAAAGGEDCPETVGRYLGVDLRARYDVVLAPLLRRVPYSTNVARRDGVVEARTLVCPLDSPELLVGNLYLPSRHAVLAKAWHELAHIPMDPWAEAHAERMRPHEALYARIQGVARREGWVDCFAEHLVRAPSHRLLLSRCGPKAAQRLAAKDRAEGYIFIVSVAERLAEYEASRDRYPTLADFIPRWLTLLETL